MQLDQLSIGFLVSSFSILFVIEWSQIDQDHQSDLVFTPVALGLITEINLNFDRHHRSTFTCRVSLSDDLGP